MNVCMDRWVPKVGALQTLAMRPLTDRELIMPIIDCMLPSGGWNWALLRAVIAQ